MAKRVSSKKPRPQRKRRKTPMTSRLGFLAGQFAVPEDFNRMGRAEILALFTSSKVKA